MLRDPKTGQFVRLGATSAWNAPAVPIVIQQAPAQFGASLLQNFVTAISPKSSVGQNPNEDVREITPKSVLIAIILSGIGGPIWVAYWHGMVMTLITTPLILLLWLVGKLCNHPDAFAILGYCIMGASQPLLSQYWPGPKTNGMRAAHAAIVGIVVLMLTVLMR